MDNIVKNFLQKNQDPSKILGRKNNRNFAVAVLFCEVEDETYILFEKRAANIPQGGEIALPGGKKDETDKTYLETAFREVYEEIGLSPGRIINKKDYGKLIMPTGELIEVKLGCVENFSLDELRINEDEVEEVFLVPLKFFLESPVHIETLMVENKPSFVREGKKIDFPVKELDLPIKYRKPWGRERKVYFYKYNNYLIWGITGEIIYYLIEEMKKIEEKQ